MSKDFSAAKRMASVFVGAGLLLAASGAVSAPITFFGEDTSTAGTGLGPNAAAARTSFLLNLSGVGNEDFESFSGSENAPLGLTFPGSGGTLNANLTGVGYVRTFPGYGRFPTSGSNFWEVSTGSFAIDFLDPVNAFGFNGIDIGDFVPEQMVLNVTKSNGTTVDLTVPHSLGIGNFDQATLFYGLIDSDESFTRIEFTNSGGGDVFAFDDMVIGDIGQIVPDPTPNPVPVPSPLLLLGLGLLGLRFARRNS